MVAISSPPNPTEIQVTAMPLISSTQKTLRNISHHETNGHHGAFPQFFQSSLTCVMSFFSTWVAEKINLHALMLRVFVCPDASFDSPHHRTQWHAASQIQPWNGWIEATRKQGKLTQPGYSTRWEMEEKVEDMESHIQILWFLDLKGFSCWNIIIQGGKCSWKGRIWSSIKLQLKWGRDLE